jgi:hypothetical protein
MGISATAWCWGTERVVGERILSIRPFCYTSSAPFTMTSLTERVGPHDRGDRSVLGVAASISLASDP